MLRTPLFALCVLPLVVVGCVLPPDEEPVDSLVGGVEKLTPAEGVTFVVPPFEVPPGTEVQDCYFFEVPDLNDGQPIWIDRFKLGQRSGSHHMNVFRVNTVVNLTGRPGDVVRGGECRASPNWADWPLVVNSQESNTADPVIDWRLPDGVAQRFEPHELLMIQTHYVNADLQTTPNGGEVRVNFYKTAVAAPIEMGTLFATQQSIRICQSAPEPQVFSGTCSFPGDQEIHVIGANGHFHSRGKKFEMFAWDGFATEPSPDDLFYSSTRWDEPPMSIDLDQVVPAGGGVWWNCEFEWRDPSAGCDVVNERDPSADKDCCYTFGGIVETSEHCNAFVYYYPKVDSDIFCN